MEMLARDGVLFEKAMAQAPWTRPSVATQLTSWPPHRHGARFKSGSISPEAVSMVEVMNRAGYYCSALYSNQHVGAQWGFGRGYHRYGPPPIPGWPGLSLSMMGLRAIANVVPGLGARSPGAKTPRYFALAREMLTNPPHGAPLFLYLHFMDPHDPYRSHGSGRPSFRRADAENPGPAVAEMFRQAYRDEIRYFDGHLREFLEWLRSEGLYDDLLIIFVSDHGEEFFEHGGYWHGLTLYEEQLHVPLIVKLPGNRFAGSRQASMVRLLDVAPTLAAVAGLDLPDVWMGRPLLGPAGLVDPAVAEAVSETDLEGGGLRALRGRRHKLVLAQEHTSRNVPRRSLFDLESDPAESRDRSAEDPEHARQLEQALMVERGGDLWR
jgi:arylsulfatase A-like enzyme